MNLQNNVKTSLKTAFCDSGNDASACSIYKDIFEPLIKITETFLEIPNFKGCIGDFFGSQINEENADQIVKDLGCVNIPVSDSIKYGGVASSLTITTGMQMKLQGLGLWNIPGDKLTPSFCLTIRDPGCGGFTLGISLNGDTYATILQLAPAGGGIIDNILAILGEIVEAGLDQTTFAISTNGGLNVPVSVYSPSIGWQEANVLANIHFEIVAKIIELPFLQGAYSQKLLEVKAGFSRSIAFGNMNEDSFTNLLSNPINSGADLAKGYSEVLTIEGKLSLALSGVTSNLLPDLEMIISAQAYLVGNSASQTAFNLPAGLYMQVSITDIPIISQIVNVLCNFFSGVTSFLGNLSCPEISINTEAKFGLYIQKEELGIILSAGDVDLKCSVKNIHTGQPKINCDFLDVLFQILWDGIEFVISKITDFAQDVGEEIFKIGAATFNAIGDDVVGFGNDVIDTAEDVGEGFIDDLGDAGNTVGNGIVDVVETYVPPIPPIPPTWTPPCFWC